MNSTILRTIVGTSITTRRVVLRLVCQIPAATSDAGTFSPTLHSVSSFFLSFFLFKRLSARRDKAEIRGEKVSTTETSGLINRAFFARELYVLRSRETIFIIVDEFRISKNKKR